MSPWCPKTDECGDLNWQTFPARISTVTREWSLYIFVIEKTWLLHSIRNFRSIANRTRRNNAAFSIPAWYTYWRSCTNLISKVLLRRKSTTGRYPTVVLFTRLRSFPFVHSNHTSSLVRIVPEIHCYRSTIATEKVL